MDIETSRAAIKKGRSRVNTTDLIRDRKLVTRAFTGAGTNHFVVALHRNSSRAWMMRWQSRGFSRGNQLAVVRRKRPQASATCPFRQTVSFARGLLTPGGRASTHWKRSIEIAGTR